MRFFFSDTFNVIASSEASETDIPLLTGRLIDPDPASQKTFTLAKGWLNDCMSAHKACTDDTDGTGPVTPTRLVEIGTGAAFNDMRIIETRGGTIPYAYLSHVWGSAIPWTLRKQNYDEVLSGRLSLEDMTTTVADAISIVRSCGLRYIWVDSLCIIQDCPEDWEREASRIPDYSQ
ncbi:HET domain-containing protein, partial [Candidatus Bathyarchaeota archaeon]|nr:HET domain-containing protein [Candidatus Bathyarchaeota archaeon]